MKKLFMTALLCVAVLQAPGAGARDAGTKSASLRLIGYRLKVTLNAPFDEFSAFFTRTGTEELKLGADLGKFFNPDGTPKPLGTSFPSDFRKGIIRIKGRTILAKADRNNIWIIWDNPESYQARRWHFEPKGDKTEITVNMVVDVGETEHQALLKKMGENLVRNTMKNLDLTIARIQAHFDPSINPEELTSLGLRGEIYEKLAQVQEASFSTRASYLKARALLLNPGDVDLGLAKTPGGCLGGPEPDKGVLHCRVDSDMGADPTDAFVLKADKTGRTIRRTYLISGRDSAMVDVEASPSVTGSRITVRWILELPEAEMDMSELSFLSGLQKRTGDAARAIVDRLEAKP